MLRDLSVRAECILYYSEQLRHGEKGHWRTNCISIAASWSYLIYFLWIFCNFYKNFHSKPCTDQYTCVNTQTLTHYGQALMAYHVVFVGGHSLWQHVNYIIATCEFVFIYGQVIKSCVLTLHRL